MNQADADLIAVAIKKGVAAAVSSIAVAVLGEIRETVDEEEKPKIDRIVERLRTLL